MTLQNTKMQIPWPEPDFPNGAGGLSISSSSTKAVNVVQMPVGGSLTKIMVRFGTVTTAADLRLRIETLLNGSPTGTLIGTNATGAVVSPAASTMYEITLDAAQTVTAGQQFAVLLDFPATTPNLQLIRIQSGYGAGAYAMPYGIAAGTNSSSTFIMAFCIDGVWVHIPGIFPFSGTIASSVSTSTSPSERGNRFILPFKARVSGVWLNSTALKACTLQIYDLSDVVQAQATLTTASGLVSIGGTGGLQQFMFDTPVDLAAGFEGRVTIKPTSTTALTMGGFDLNAAAHMNAIAGGSNVWRTTKTGGTWTDTTTGREHIGLLISHLGDEATVNNRKILVGGSWVSA